MKRPTIVYIAGYGRSGSTILDIILGDKEKFFSAGELAYLFEEWGNQKRKCSCGSRYENCPVWGAVSTSINYSLETAGKIVREVEERKSVVDIFRNYAPGDKELINDYINIQTSLFDILSAHGARYIVDSSKTAKNAYWRPVTLQLLAGFDVKVIHLYRPLIDTLKSILKGSNWGYEGYVKNKKTRLLRSIIGWTIANIGARKIRKYLGKENCLFVHYKKMRKNPSITFNRLGEFLGEDFSEIVQKVIRGESFEVAHNVGGNRLRLSGKVAFSKIENTKASLLRDQ